jgi:hypothetical protein
LPEPRSRLSDGFIEHLMSLRRIFEELVEEDGGARSPFAEEPGI